MTISILDPILARVKSENPYMIDVEAIQIERKGTNQLVVSFEGRNMLARGQGTERAETTLPVYNEEPLAELLAPILEQLRDENPGMTEMRVLKVECDPENNQIVVTHSGRNMWSPGQGRETRDTALDLIDRAPAANPYV